ncbi:hypothetical protein [Listeria phage LMTA-148]|uniref:Uncharacterized protein n=1 Tax=Listeria phage LMTA-148 TaxID=1486413 RepID=A0A068CBS4_9CAUD|nr:hypothetical protein LD12_gp047 [Listeria phage LMTA-148]AID17324.1 hypothetical protein [Listeria phage LMTA-148]
MVKKRNMYVLRQKGFPYAYYTTSFIKSKRGTFVLNWEIVREPNQVRPLTSLTQARSIAEILNANIETILGGWEVDESWGATDYENKYVYVSYVQDDLSCTYAKTYLFSLDDSLLGKVAVGDFLYDSVKESIVKVRSVHTDTSNLRYKGRTRKLKTRLPLKEE